MSLRRFLAYFMVCLFAFATWGSAIQFTIRRIFRITAFPEHREATWFLLSEVGLITAGALAMLFVYWKIVLPYLFK